MIQYIFLALLIIFWSTANACIYQADPKSNGTGYDIDTATVIQAINWQYPQSWCEDSCCRTLACVAFFYNTTSCVLFSSEGRCILSSHFVSSHSGSHQNFKIIFFAFYRDILAREWIPWSKLPTATHTW
jgi:hypothetical protein